MYQVGNKVEVKFTTSEGDVIKESQIVDKEIHPNGAIAYRLANGTFVRPDQVLGRVYDNEYSKQKKKLKL